MTYLFLVQLLMTWYMIGIIWLVQLVHYVLFRFAGAEEFREYEEQHQMRIAPVVAPVMMIELVTAIALWFLPGPLPLWAVLVNIAGVVGIWATTYFVQVPQHVKLAEGYNRELIVKLVHDNWLRTGLWTVRGFLLAYFVPVVG